MPKIPDRIKQDNRVNAAQDNSDYRAIAAKRTERLAINLFDLDRIDPTVRSILLGGKLDADRANVIRIDKDLVDGEYIPSAAVPFSCPLFVAASICDTIRSHDHQAGSPPTRVYLWRGKAWSRQTANALLTIVDEDRVRLNPDIFAPLAEEAPPLEPPEFEAVVIGGAKIGASDWLSPPDEQLDSDIPF